MLVTITPLLSKVFVTLALRLQYYFENCCIFPIHQFASRNSLERWDALLVIPHRLQAMFEFGYETRLVQLDFSSAFENPSPSPVV